MRFLMAVTVFALLTATASAGPIGRRSVATTRSSTCTDGTCSTASTRSVVRGGGAQAHAEAMASTGSMVHARSHGSTYEGVGVGGSPQAALRACCNNGGAVLEEGVAQSSSGRWFACRRYSLR